MSTPTTSLVASSGNSIINATLNGGRWLSSNLTWGTGDNPYQGYSFANPANFAVSVGAVLQQFANVCNLTFQYAGHTSDFTASSADLTLTRSDATFFQSFDTLGRGIFPLTGSGDDLLSYLGATRVQYPQPEGDIALSVMTAAFNNLSPGSEGFYVLMHELGHTLGLKHPHDNGAAGFPTFAQAGIASLDNGRFTVMSYNSNANTFGLFPQTLGMLDILGLQYLYGANTSYHSGNDIYTLLSNSTIQTIWDAGGVDAFDASGLSSRVVIRLDPGAYSLTATSDYGIALNVTIENASGGSGNDDLYGNSVSNVLMGNAGLDLLVGFEGDDALDGGGGADTMVGGLGNDSYSVDSSSDVVTEASGEGTDTIQTTLTNVSLASYANVENLSYTGGAAFVGQGTSGANVLSGGSGNDFIYAYGGDDTVSGNAGVDVFILADGNDTAHGGDGQDYFFGDLGNDTLFGDGDVDVFNGGDGADTMFGGDGGDFFYGDAGDDTAFGEAGNDIFVMTAGNDTASGGAGQDYFYMGDGDDTLNGGDGVDVMLGEAGNDTFNPGLGVDYVFMGTGTDRLNVDKTQSGVTVLQDFTPGAASGDVISLTGTGFTTFAQVQAAITDFTASGGFCILTLDADTSVWLIGVQPGQLTPDDFIFGP